MGQGRERGKSMLYLIGQAIINGVMNGAVYALIAVGITIIFGVMRLINFASGAFLMLSMYIGYIMYTLTGLDCYTLIPVVAVIAAIVAFVSFKLAVYPALQRNKDATIIATVGLGFLLQNLIIILFGSSPLNIPSSLSTKALQLGEYSILMPRFIAFAGALALVIFLHFLLSYTNFGRAMRATSENAEVAQMLGIKAKSIYVYAWVIGIVLTSIGGVMLTPIYTLTPTVGTAFKTACMMAVVLGGLGDIRGSFICGIGLGVMESIVATVSTANLGLLGVYVTYIVVFLFFPRGIFGKNERVA